MRLEKLDPSARTAAGGVIVERSYEVKSSRDALRMARKLLHDQPFYGKWRVIREDGTSVDFLDLASAIDMENTSKIEWR